VIVKDALVVAAAALVLASCKPKEERRAPPPPAPSAPVTPPDKLRPGELAEGAIDAFGLKLPRLLSVDATFPDATFASGDVRAEHVAGYVRERVIAEHEDKADVKTVFTGATVKTAPSRRLRIEVVARRGGTQLIVRDETRPPAKEGLSEEERWRELGLTPKGEPLDPTKLE
jgi:hypothetical protein